ncbi:hypothetical protein C1I92_25410 [Jiangella anatolica]|uniref:Uncharacterized protein n=2 Tax=Jiangella anatolica TaxID=2670374 RepID=A0A2W2BWW7_9ACTN|nr:hypothetical protein C1I92_25410 [Jiangella anatolica]
MAAPSEEAPSWQDRVLPDRPAVDEPTPAVLTTAGLVSEVFADPSLEEVWAQYHYTDDGGRVVLNLVAGWEDIVGDEVRELIATAPAPVEVREVEHSFHELMQPALDIMFAGGDVDLAGAALTSGSIDPELNALVIGMTEVSEASVTAAVETFGPDVYVRQEGQAQLLSD